MENKISAKNLVNQLGKNEASFVWRRGLGAGLLACCLLTGIVGTASADSWLDSMGEGSGVDRQASPDIVTMQASIQNDIASSFDYSNHIVGVSGPVSVPSVPACDGGGCGDELDDPGGPPPED